MCERFYVVVCLAVPFKFYSDCLNRCLRLAYINFFRFLVCFSLLFKIEVTICANISLIKSKFFGRAKNYF